MRGGKRKKTYKKGYFGRKGTQRSRKLVETADKLNVPGKTGNGKKTWAKWYFKPTGPEGAVEGFAIKRRRYTRVSKAVPRGEWGK